MVLYFIVLCAETAAAAAVMNPNKNVGYYFLWKGQHTECVVKKSPVTNASHKILPYQNTIFYPHPAKVFNMKSQSVSTSGSAIFQGNVLWRRLNLAHCFADWFLKQKTNFFHFEYYILPPTI